MSRNFCCFIICLISLVLSIPAEGELSRIVVNKSEFFQVLPITMTKNAVSFKGLNLYSINLEKRSLSLIFSSTTNFGFTEFSLISPEHSLSPDGKYIALLLQDSSDTPNKQPAFKNILLILDIKTGKYNKVSNRIIEYCWSPSSDSIAYITGFPQDDFPGFESDGVWIYDIQTRNNTKIFSSGRRINWSNYDNNIYITDYYSVYSYIVNERKIKKTELKGIYISPDGKYYASSPHETESSVVYRKDTNKRDDTINNLLAELLDYYYFQSWLSRRNYLLVSGGQFNNLVIDVDSGNIINRFEGNIIGIDCQGKYALIQEIVETERRKRINRETIKIINLYP